jgi:hypothetical protein
MGLFDLLSKEGRQKSALEGATKRVQDKYAQSADRYSAMEKLRNIGSEDALYGLCKRWNVSYDKTIEDDQEKQWAQDTLVSFGERAVPALRRFLKEADRVSYALTTLSKVASEAEILAILDEVLAKEEPGYTRDPSKKQQLMTWLGEWRGASTEVARRVAPYFQDFDQDVRFHAIDAIAHHLGDGVEEVARAPLLAALLRREEESRRIKVRAAEVLAEAGWKVTDRKEEVARLLGDDLTMFAMDHDKLVGKKKGPR